MRDFSLPAPAPISRRNKFPFIRKKNSIIIIKHIMKMGSLIRDVLYKSYRMTQKTVNKYKPVESGMDLILLI